ncbi:hypothetical protein R3W88_031358 [Solanum pinnatisectum]|uniref:Uncharacterized protein n=1 Tax=Solanum pinnatisectum TaxID=50273 RepID=A0AAV9LL45_9SOLN|nr:hypothetical protein R3W88_031358 [Solanum pinnatisectum]
MSFVLTHTRSKGTPPSPPLQRTDYRDKGKMVDNNSRNERRENFEGGQLPNDLVLRLERKISELEEEVAHMRDSAKLSISLGTHFGENIYNHPHSKQTTLPNNPPINISRPKPTHPNIFPPLHAQTTQMPFYHYHQQTKPTIPEPIPNVNPPYAPRNNNPNPIYVKNAPVTHNYHESESSQKNILIKTLTERLDSLANRVQHVEKRKRRGQLDDEMYHTVELVGNIEVQPWFTQKIIDMMALFGFMGGIIDELLEYMNGLSLAKEEGKGCNVVINEEEKGDPRGSNEAKISISIWTSTPSKPHRASG